MLRGKIQHRVEHKVVLDLRGELRAAFVSARGWQRTHVRFDGPRLARQTLRAAQPDRWGRVIEDMPPWADHTEWYRIGRKATAIVTQPYALSAAQQSEMAAWADKLGLRFVLPDYPSWHFPGWTRLVVFECAMAEPTEPKARRVAA